MKLIWLLIQHFRPSFKFPQQSCGPFSSHQCAVTHRLIKAGIMLKVFVHNRSFFKASHFGDWDYFRLQVGKLILLSPSSHGVNYSIQGITRVYCLAIRWRWKQFRKRTGFKIPWRQKLARILFLISYMVHTCNLQWEMQLALYKE
jgi:hypothetical protein